jgi:hypothetical protein
MNVDFSNLNFDYLAHARDLAKEDLDLAALLLDMPHEFAESLWAVDAPALRYLLQMKSPLLIPRHEMWWWTRLFDAFRGGNPTEIQAVIGQAAMFFKKP